MRLRRQWLARLTAALLAGVPGWRAAAALPAFAPVVPGYRMRFPDDHGAHPGFRTEWWYITGWLDTGDAASAGSAPGSAPGSDGSGIGVQITFFRSRTGHDPANPSRFAPTQLLLAHAALAYPPDGRLRHDQRAARMGFGAVQAATGDTRLALQGWELARDGDDRYRTRITARDFALDLVFQPGAAPRLQGDAGFSRKGPNPAQASYYYSRPQLGVSGEIRLDGRRLPVRTGRAWLDHEWSSEVLDPQASGWDWVGLNLDDGSALMAFRIRTRSGATLWSHARWLTGEPSAPTPVFEALRRWRSPRSAAQYPVAMRVSVSGRQFELAPIFDDQEIDARASTGGFYWEGAVRVAEQGRPVGRGYLELTGYAAPLRL